MSASAFRSCLQSDSAGSGQPSRLHTSDTRSALILTPFLRPLPTLDGDRSRRVCVFPHEATNIGL